MNVSQAYLKSKNYSKTI